MVYLSAVERREKKKQKKQEKSQSHVNHSQTEELSSENYPLNPPFNCTVLYRNVLNVLVLGTFL